MLRLEPTCFLIGATLVVATAACTAHNNMTPDGATSDVQPDTGIFIGTTVDSGVSLDSSCLAGIPVCPSAATAFGAPCALPFGTHCEYGDDPEPNCNTVAWCDPTNGWEVQSPIAGSACPTVLPATCPSTFAAAQSGGAAACSGTVSQCIYPEGNCDCEQLSLGSPLLALT